MKNYGWHKFMFAFCCVVAGPIIRYKMKYKCKKYKLPDKPCLILANHVTDLDPALLGMAFSKHFYFLASEHAFRAGFGSKVLKFMFDPIPFNKAKTDISAIKEMIKRLKSGASMCLFPEGDKSFTGETALSTLSVTKLAKTSGADIITFRIEGGYFTSPRWSATMRKGKMFGSVVRRFTSEDLANMTDEQVLEEISKDIYEDAYVRQDENPVRYRGENLAENIETALYLCPQCEGIGTLKSKGDSFWCNCGLKGIYTETGYLEGENLPFSKTTDWGKWQSENLARVIAKIKDGPICSDKKQQMYEVHHAKYKVPAGEGSISIDSETLSCCGKVFPLENIMKIAIVGQMTLLFAEKHGAMYEVRSSVSRSALKYREIFKVLTER